MLGNSFCQLVVFVCYKSWVKTPRFPENICSIRKTAACCHGLSQCYHKPYYIVCYFVGKRLAKRICVMGVQMKYAAAKITDFFHIFQKVFFKPYVSVCKYKYAAFCHGSPCVSRCSRAFSFFIQHAGAHLLGQLFCVVAAVRVYNNDFIVSHRLQFYGFYAVFYVFAFVQSRYYEREFNFHNLIAAQSNKNGFACMAANNQSLLDRQRALLSARESKGSKRTRRDLNPGLKLIATGNEMPDDRKLKFFMLPKTFLFKTSKLNYESY